MTRKKLSILIGSVCLALVLVLPLVAGCPAPTPTPTPTPTPAPATYEWRLAQYHADPESIPYIVGEEFIKQAEQLSDGKFVIKHYPGELLGDYLWLQEQCSMGLVDFYIGTVATTLSARLDVVNIPALSFDWDTATEVAFKPGFIDMCKAVGKDVGWMMFGLFPVGQNLCIANIKFTPTPEGVAPLGLKSRCMVMKSDELTVDALGFIACPMPWSELPTGLITGVIDVACGPAYMDLPIFTGITKYVYDYWYRVEKQPVVMSLRVWDTLSEEDQAILIKAGEAAVAKGWEIGKNITLSCKAKTVSEWGYEEIIELTLEQHMANLRVIREEVWPELEKTLGKDVIDYAKTIAVPLE